MALETITSNLCKGYKQLVPETFQTSAELMAERQTNEELRNIWFYTSNYAVYDIEDGEAVLYFGERENNPILKNIDEACEQLINERNYKVPELDVQSAKDSALRVKIKDLGLKYYNHEFVYFELDTKNHQLKLLAEKVYGNLDENMKLLSDNGIKKTRIYVLNPEYVENNAKEGAIARACWLDDFYDDSYFVADSRGVDVNGGLRGVLKSAEGGAKNLVTLAEDKFYELLNQYVPPAILEQAKKDFKKHHKE